MSRVDRVKAQRTARRRRNAKVLTLFALIAVLVTAVFLGSKLWHSVFGSGGGEDFAGGGGEDVVVQVHAGDSTSAIAQMLQDRRVVATARAFVRAADGNESITAIQPGYYKMRTEIPAADAVDRLTDPQNRVGSLVIPEGRQLDDVQDLKTGAVTEGILTLISKATCVDLDGAQRCVTADALRDAATGESPAALGVPDWAVQPVTAMRTDHRRLEGLIAPGSWDIDPSASPAQILATLIRGSALQYSQQGLVDAAAQIGQTPYHLLTIASLVQREATPQDFSKVARVILNRLRENRTLEFDSTVNFALDRTEVATTDADRARRTPWNTYVTPGLPATPICSPGADALAAAEAPAPGDWLYFVTVDMQGTTLFTVDYQQHLANIELARRNGVLDSAR
ncbi:endolytic transglycosylase MltG [Mycobacterium sp. MYCO198283]|uniref:endolytic transglycosylase MltG n=1 Tax=Mycobacterium sp. MYCO198283 TaxID=2883505 RepID=UPI001E528D06|nr:endolytic transglycosylase MltG [Mycobacterium sp. MYCO198283]MCG5433637.1 endolytic transglycosylase MltG [Mycobacterium sp. MYCO198283]